jgi:aminoglycoside phosphotransferase (APT) family kinase protein
MVGSAAVGDPEDDFDDGWDNRATLVDGRWVERTPRFPDREPQLRRETKLLPWLAPQLPLPVPVPTVVSEDPFTVRYAYLPGGPCPGTAAAHGRAIGTFLRALHTVDPVGAMAHGLLDAESAFADAQETRDRMRADVLCRLPHHLLPAGAELLDRASRPPSDPRVVHADLGLTHIRVTGEEVTGVIDWGDSCLGDPAIDLAATTMSAGPAFAEAVVAAYRPDDDLLARALDWHLLGPWHEVLYGLGEGGPEYVESGLAGTIARLERAGRHPNRA